MSALAYPANCAAGAAGLHTAAGHVETYDAPMDTPKSIGFYLPLCLSRSVGCLDLN